MQNFLLSEEKLSWIAGIVPFLKCKVFRETWVFFVRWVWTIDYWRKVFWWLLWRRKELKWKKNFLARFLRKYGAISSIEFWFWGEFLKICGEFLRNLSESIINRGEFFRTWGEILWIWGEFLSCGEFLRNFCEFFINWGEFIRIYGEFNRIWGEFHRIWGEF